MKKQVKVPRSCRRKAGNSGRKAGTRSCRAPRRPTLPPLTVLHLPFTTKPHPIPMKSAPHSPRTGHNTNHTEVLLWCKKCKKPNHKLDICWKIYGKHVDWKPSRGRHTNIVVFDQPSSA